MKFPLIIRLDWISSYTLFSEASFVNHKWAVFMEGDKSLYLIKIINCRICNFFTVKFDFAFKDMKIARKKSKQGLRKWKYSVSCWQMSTETEILNPAEWKSLGHDHVHPSRFPFPTPILLSHCTSNITWTDKCLGDISFLFSLSPPAVRCLPFC